MNQIDVAKIKIYQSLSPEIYMNLQTTIRG